jgi:CubicO group peptidase (beta-lactamase class C family)
MKRPFRQLGMLLLLMLPGSAAIAQNGRFDLEKTQSVLTGLIRKSLADSGVPSMSIALVRGDSIVWKAAFGYANMRTRTPAVRSRDDKIGAHLFQSRRSHESDTPQSHQRASAEYRGS